MPLTYTHWYPGSGFRSRRRPGEARSSSWCWLVSWMRSTRFVRTSFTSPNAAALNAIAKASVATTVRRTRTDCGHQCRRGAASSVIGQELVARAAHGLDRLHPERRVDLLAEVADVHLHDVGVAREVDAPHVVEDL